MTITLLSSSVFARPITLILDESNRRSVIEGGNDAYAGAETQKVILNPVALQFDRGDYTLVDSNGTAVAVTNDLATPDSAGNARLTARSGADEAFAELALNSDESGANPIPLLPVGFE